MRKMIGFSLCILLLLSLCACTPEEIKESYENGVAALSRGRYADAANFFIECEEYDYEDSSEKLLEIYYAAVNLFEQQEYEQAQEIFEAIAISASKINDVDKYIAVLNAYNEVFSRRDVKTFIEKTSTHLDLKGVSDLQSDILSLCYEGTYVIKFEYIAPSGETYNVKEEYNEDFDSTRYTYRGDYKIAESDILAYESYLMSIGAEENKEYNWISYFYEDMDGEYISVFFHPEFHLGYSVSVSTHT